MKLLKILVVDDDRDFAEALGEALESAGHQVLVCYSGEAGLAAFELQAFDLAFFDVVLPGLSGVETLARVRALRPTARVLMMTGYSFPELLDRARREGAIDILYKPLDITRLLQRLQALFPEGVLVVDDDADFAEALQTALAAHGYRACLARTAGEALARCAAGHIDLLVLDVRLAGASGVDVLSELQRQGRAPPTLFVTGFDKSELPIEVDNTRVALISKTAPTAALLRSLQQLRRAHDPI
jgi:two-component system, NtrC family, response regulator HydG